MKKTTPFDKESLLDLFKHEKRPLSINDLRSVVDSWKQQKREVKNLLKELIREGALVHTER